VRAAHTCRSLMPKGNSTSHASRGSADPLEPGFPASEANLAVPGELVVGCAGHLGVGTWMSGLGLCFEVERLQRRVQSPNR
jgi:hypothetical protein